MRSITLLEYHLLVHFGVFLLEIICFNSYSVPWISYGSWSFVSEVPPPHISAQPLHSAIEANLLLKLEKQPTFWEKVGITIFDYLSLYDNLNVTSLFDLEIWSLILLSEMLLLILRVYGLVFAMIGIRAGSPTSMGENLGVF